MGESRECTLCGDVYLDADRHRAWHDEIDAWIQAVEQEVRIRMRERARGRRDESPRAHRPSPET